jgi:hypothetical protein
VDAQAECSGGARGIADQSARSVLEAGRLGAKAAQDLGIPRSVRADRLSALLRDRAFLSIAEAVRHRLIHDAAPSQRAPTCLARQGLCACKHQQPGCD